MKISDFTFDIELLYFKFMCGDIEITLEPCLNGFDVAVYKNLRLLEPKVCTDMKPGSKAREKALGIAGQFKAKYCKKSI